MEDKHRTSIHQDKIVQYQSDKFKVVLDFQKYKIDLKDPTTDLPYNSPEPVKKLIDECDNKTPYDNCVEKDKKSVESDSEISNKRSKS